MGLFDIFTGGSVKDAAAQNQITLDQLKAEGMGHLNKGLKSSTGAINTNVIDPFKSLASKYGSGTDLYLDSLGVNGPQGNTNAVNSFQAGPGYQWNVDQATDAINRAADARGAWRGGNAIADIGDRVSGLANQEYGNWQTRLAGLMPAEMQATAGQAAGGTTLAGLYDQDASRRVGLASNVAGGMMGNNNMAANAEMAGSGNLWNMGLNLLKLGVGGGKA